MQSLDAQGVALSSLCLHQTPQLRLRKPWRPSKHTHHGLSPLEVAVILVLFALFPVVSRVVPTCGTDAFLDWKGIVVYVLGSLAWV